MFSSPEMVRVLLAAGSVPRKTEDAVGRTTSDEMKKWDRREEESCLLTISVDPSSSLFLPSFLPFLLSIHGISWRHRCSGECIEGIGRKK